MSETPQQAARRLAAAAIRDGYKPEALHAYTDAKGNPLHWRIRLKNPDTGDKWIRPMKPNGKGYALGEPEYPEGKPLYRLHHLASRPGDPVLVCEGEWCADALAKVGALAITSGAADSAGKTDWRSLAGRSVTIWPDNDEPGQRYAEAVAEALRALGCTVRVIDVAALGLPPKGDVLDWLAANPDATAADIAVLPTITAAENAPAGATEFQAVIEAAIENLTGDIGAVFEPPVITALKAMREAQPADYQRYRKRIKDAGASVTELDRLVCVGSASEDRELAGEEVSFPEPEPCPEVVDGAELLDELTATYRRYVVLPEYADIALALWTVHAYSYDYGRCTPILALTSPQKRCGKTTLMSVLRGLVNKPLAASSISPSCVFRSIDRWQPTLLIDEADSFLKDNEALRGIINSGHTRELAYVIRAVGDDYEPRKFSTWCPKAIALIGKLPPTLHDRAIVIPLVRKTVGESVHRLKELDGGDIRRKCARWVSDHTDRLRRADPVVPPELHDRAADNWRGLLAIADLAGAKWPEEARKAAKALAEGDDDTESFAVMLLADIRDLFKKHKTDKLFSEDVVTHLHTLEDRPWSQWGRGQKPITKNQVARLLKPFKIKPTTRRDSAEVARGYELHQFYDAFARFLPNQNATPLQSLSGAASQGFRSVTPENNVTDENSTKPAPDKDCNGVADRNGVAQERKRTVIL